MAGLSLLQERESGSPVQQPCEVQDTGNVQDKKNRDKVEEDLFVLCRKTRIPAHAPNGPMSADTRRIRSGIRQSPFRARLLVGTVQDKDAQVCDRGRARWRR